MGKSTISMAIFNSYISLPEGMDNCSSYCQHGAMVHHVPLESLEIKSSKTG